MTSPTPEFAREPLRSVSPVPLNSLVASAQRITSAHMKDRRGFGKPESWQEDAWDMYDLVGEQRFLATTLSGRLSQAKFYVGKVSEDPIEPPEPLDSDEHVAAQAFAYFGDSPQARAQMVQRLGVNLFVAGDGWLAGIPRHLLPNAEPGDYDPDPMTSLEDLEWRMLSVSEVSSQQDEITLTLGDGKSETLRVDPDDIFLIRVWRPHPRKWWQADSPTRASLAILRELVGLTMHISAQVDSRLAGAGILVVPASAKRAIAIAAGLDPNVEDDPFTEALMSAMMTAIQDRSSASAVVPLVITVPDESTGLFQHLTFSTPLDSEARSLRDEAIRRLALGQDAPPELLLGTSGMNHWGAWLVQEDVVTTHIEPPLALICDAITTQFLWPVLIEQGMDEDEAREYVVWYDVGHMVQRPNRLGDATMLHEKGIVSDTTLREAAGFGEADEPTRLSEPVRIAVDMAKANPALVDNMAEIVKAFEEILNPSTQAITVAQADDVSASGDDVTEEVEAPVDDEEGDASQTPTKSGAQKQGPPNDGNAPSMAASAFSNLFTPGANQMIIELAKTGIVGSTPEDVAMWLLKAKAEQFKAGSGWKTQWRNPKNGQWIDMPDVAIADVDFLEPRLKDMQDSDGPDSPEFMEAVEQASVDINNHEGPDTEAIKSARDALDTFKNSYVPSEESDLTQADEGDIGSEDGPDEPEVEADVDVDDPMDAQDFRPATDEERKALKVPKAWTDVEINHAPQGRVAFRGKDSAGRAQATYSAEHTKAASAEKFARMKALHEKIPALDAVSPSDPDDTNKVVSLMRRMALRPGSDSDTKAKVKAYGATNLLAEHVVIEGDQVSLRFIGKKGVAIDLPVEDGEIEKMLRAQVKDRKSGERLFDTDPRKANAAMKKITGPEFTVKDLRTYKANEIAFEQMSEMDPPTTMAEFRKQRKAVAVAVSARLGNTPTMALSSYINPAVFGKWEAALQSDEKGTKDA